MKHVLQAFAIFFAYVLLVLLLAYIAHRVR